MLTLQERNLIYKYSPRRGLDGPFNIAGRVLYYDPKEGKYYDPRTDFYVSNAEYFRMIGLM